MCGIAGLVGSQANCQAAASMLDVIVHRGPDDSGLYLGSGAAIGMRRLSIIDLEGGHQPMVSPDGRYAIVFNGEIYNYVELAAELRDRGLPLRTRSDTEVILRLYEAEGAACLQRLRGMFAIAIWDEATRRLFLARDRLGKKPLYYGWVGETLAFASELKCFRRLPGVDLSLDPVAVDEYFTFRYVPDPRTILASFRKLPPGHCLRLEAGRVTVDEYWRPAFGDPSTLSLDEAEEELACRLDEAVRLRLRSDVPVGAFLSGGVDSSVVVALMAKHATQPVHTFSVGWQGHTEIDELKAARPVAERFGTRHEEVVVDLSIAEVLPKVVWHLDEPLADPAAVPTFVMSAVAGRSLKVVLCGEGADELFGGYPYLRRLQRLAWLPPRPALVRAAGGWLAPRLPRRGLAGSAARAVELLCNDLSAALRLTLSVFGERERARLLAPLGLARPQPAPATRDVNGLLLELTRTWLPGDLLMKVDKMTMAASLEARAPFLDHTLFDFVSRLPSHFKVDGATSKRLLRRTAQRWLPSAVVWRPKQGFGVPIATWLRGELQPLLCERLSPERLARHGCLEPSAVEALLQEFAAGAPHALKLWTLLSFQLWYDSFYGTA